MTDDAQSLAEQCGTSVHATEALLYNLQEQKIKHQGHAAAGRPEDSDIPRGEDGWFSSVRAAGGGLGDSESGQSHVPVTRQYTREAFRSQQGTAG